MSIRMIKLCGKTIAIPLKLIFRSILEEGVFPDDRKKNNLVPTHKRGSKNLIKIIDISAFSLFSVKALKELYLIPCSITLYKTNYSLNVRLASFQAIQVLLNSSQLRMKST